MQKATIWHNPRCSKSRETLALLQSGDTEIQIVDYLETPPSVEQIDHALQLLHMQPRDLMRHNEQAYHGHQLDDPALGRAALVAALHEFPILIQRPIVFANGQARIGRPPQRVLEIL